MKSNHPLCTYSLELQGEPFLNVRVFLVLQFSDYCRVSKYCGSISNSASEKQPLKTMKS